MQEQDHTEIQGQDQEIISQDSFITEEIAEEQVDNNKSNDSSSSNTSNDDNTSNDANAQEVNRRRPWWYG